MNIILVRQTGLLAALCISVLSRTVAAQTITYMPSGTDNSAGLTAAIANNTEVILVAAPYPIKRPINCGRAANYPGTWIHGPGVDANVNTAPPALITVTGTNNFGSSDTAAVNLGNYCRWSGVSVDTGGKSNPMTGTQLDTVKVTGTHVVIDDHALLINGRYNINCGTTQVDGLQVKDTQLITPTLGNIYIPGQCGNVRLLGDLISGSNGFGVLFGGDDNSIEGGVIEQSQGIGLDFETAKMASVTGMYIDDNGVEAFGRVASAGTTAAQVLITSLDQFNSLPTNFPTAPGNTSTSSSTSTAYRFQAWTTGNGTVRVRASASATPFTEITDGWRLLRLK